MYSGKLQNYLQKKANNQLQKVNVERQKLINTERKIELLREEIDLDKKNNDLAILKIDREKTLKTKNELSIGENDFGNFLDEGFTGFKNQSRSGMRHNINASSSIKLFGKTYV